MFSYLVYKFQLILSNSNQLRTATCLENEWGSLKLVHFETIRLNRGPRNKHLQNSMLSLFYGVPLGSKVCIFSGTKNNNSGTKNNISGTKNNFSGTKNNFSATKINFSPTNIIFSPTKIIFSATKINFSPTKINFSPTKNADF